MPLTQAQLTSNISVAMTRANNGYGSTTAGPTGQSFNLTGLNLSTWNQSLLATYTLFTTAPASLAATLVAGGSLTSGTTYYYKITAVGYNGTATNETSGSNEVSVTATATSATASLTWPSLSGAVSYNVYRGTATGAENLLLGNVTSLSFVDNGTITGTTQSPPSAMPNNYAEFSLYQFTTLANESATCGHILSLIIQPVGTVGSSQCVLSPGSTNGTSWFLGGTSPTVTMRINGLFVYSGPGTGDAGFAITSTANTMRVTNAGTAATTVYISTIEGP